MRMNAGVSVLILARLRKHRGWFGFADHSGSIAVVTACAFAVVLLLVGASIDFLRWQQARQITTAALDAGVLAGGLALQVDPSNYKGAVEAARAAYQANLNGRQPVTADTIEFSLADNNQAIMASGHASVATTIMAMFGHPEMGLVSESGTDMPTAQVTAGGPGGSNLEVALMLDITGSMCDDGMGPCTTGAKLSALKTAAAKLVQIVVRADQSAHTTKIGLVPFSTRVRLAADDSAAGLMKSLTNIDSPRSYWYWNCTNATGGGGSETSGNWQCLTQVPAQATSWLPMPCVTERFNNATNVFDATEDAPGPGKWLNAHGGDRWPLSADSTDTAPVDTVANGLGATAAMPDGHWNFDQAAGNCADIYPGSEIVPLTTDKSKLSNHIQSLQAYGGTAGALATSWSWYLLSPAWNQIWLGESTPASYAELTELNANGAPKLRKVAIMMTDGGYNVFRGNKEQDQQTVSNHAIEVCNAMKARGIEVYTVGFMLNTLPPTEAAIARSTLTACGSDLQHFYDSLDTVQLNTAFHKIGVKLSGLRLMR